MNPFVPATASVVLGTALGIGLSLQIQNLINTHAKDNCKAPLYSVVSLHNLLGETNYCVSNKVIYGPSNLNLPQ